MSFPLPSVPQSLTPSPQVSFVIPLFNCLPLTQAMLTSLHATLPPGLTHEIILVDDGSTDGTREWLQGLNSSNGLVTPPDASVRVLLNERNLGYAITNNRAAVIARGEFLALLNNDLVLQPGWLEPMLRVHTRLRDRAGLVGNVQLDARTGAIDHAGLELTTFAKPAHVRSLPPRLSRLLRPIRVVPAVTGACVLVRRALWQQLGGFDETYVNGGEDIDLCYRARAAGRVNAVALRSIVHHHVSSSPGRKMRDEQNSLRLARRWQTEFVADGARAWCRAYLARAVEAPSSREYKVTLAAGAFLAQVIRTPPPEATKGVTHGLAVEFARWDKMFS